MFLQVRLRELAQHWGANPLACNSQHCSATLRAWQRIARGTGTVLLQGRRYCFPECFELEICKQFERMQSLPVKQQPGTRRIPLGLLMLSRGYVNSSQLRRALERQRTQPGCRIGECLQQLGLAQEHQITAALSIQWSCPVLKSVPSPPGAFDIPLHLLTRFAMLPIHFVPATQTLHVAFACDIDYRVLFALGQMLDCRTEACLTTASQLSLALNELAQQGCASEKVFPGLRTPREATVITSSYAAKLCATRVKLVACGEFVWVRVQGETDTASLLFSLTEVRGAARG